MTCAYSQDNCNMSSINEREPTTFTVNTASIDCTGTNGYVPMVALTPSTPPESPRRLNTVDQNNFLDPKGILFEVKLPKTFYY